MSGAVEARGEERAVEMAVVVSETAEPTALAARMAALAVVGRGAEKMVGV